MLTTAEFEKLQAMITKNKLTKVKDVLGLIKESFIKDSLMVSAHQNIRNLCVHKINPVDPLSEISETRKNEKRKGVKVRTQDESERSDK